MMCEIEIFILAPSEYFSSSGYSAQNVDFLARKIFKNQVDLQIIFPQGKRHYFQAYLQSHSQFLTILRILVDLL
jgi:hypothetical protein